MARNKMINIRVEEDFRDIVRLWGKANNVEVAALLYQVLHNLVDGKLTVEQLTRPVDEDKLSELEERLTQEIHKTIDKKLPSLEKLTQEIYEKIETLMTENCSLRERVEQLELQQSKTREPKRREPKRVSKVEEVPAAVASLPSGTKLSSKELGKLIDRSDSTVNRYRTGKIKNQPEWFLQYFKHDGEKWVKK